MAEREPIITKTMERTDARQHFSEVLSQVFRGETRVVVEKSGIPVARIFSAREMNERARLRINGVNRRLERRFYRSRRPFATRKMKRLQVLEAQREEDFQALWRTGEAFQDQSPEEIEREVAKALASVRAKMRQESTLHASKS